MKKSTSVKKKHKIQNGKNLNKKKTSANSRKKYRDNGSDSDFFCSPECHLHYAMTGEISYCCSNKIKKVK